MSSFQQLFNQYDRFFAPQINTNRFQPEDFQKQLSVSAGEFPLKDLGNSVEDRPIRMVTLGNGPVKVLLWSQMHGNESTATRAILDILNFFNDTEHFHDLRTLLLKRLTLFIVPMLNPDGAARFQRRNAQEIDLNRDAREAVSPESAILRTIINELSPDFAFNLHDQHRFYNIPGTGKPSTIAFLAPPYNTANEVNGSRGKAMQLIALLRHELEQVIPGQVGVYTDVYSSRAFGDFSQRSGAATILVESGWAKDDMEKEFVRKLNFCLLLAGMEAIATGDFGQFSIDDYHQIPENDEKLFDILLRQATVLIAGKPVKLDLGIKRSETSISGATTYTSRGEVADMGDLAEWHGFEEVDASQLTLVPGKVCSGANSLSEEECMALLEEGYLYIGTNGSGVERECYPLIPVEPGFTPPRQPVVEAPANFVLQTAAGQIKYAVVNGFLWCFSR